MFRHGFKAECEDYSRELRTELKLQLHDPIDVWKLAEYLDLKIVPISELEPTIPDNVAYFRSNIGQKEFSAATFEDFIIHNDSHHRKRQASNIAHEIAHRLLIHRPTATTIKSGVRYYDVEQEKEAGWLGPALLISDEAAFHIVKLGLSVAEASDMYGVGRPLIIMRLNVTGAAKRASSSGARKK